MIGCCHFRSSVTYFCLLNKWLCYPVREHLRINYDPVRYLILTLSKQCSARIHSSMSFGGWKKSTSASAFSSLCVFGWLQSAVVCRSAGGSGFLQEVIVLLYIAKSFLEKKQKTKQKTTRDLLIRRHFKVSWPQALNKNDDGRPDGWWETLESRCVEGLRGGRAEGGGGGGMALMPGRVLDRGAGGWLQEGERWNTL